MVSGTKELHSIIGTQLQPPPVSNLRWAATTLQYQARGAQPACFP